MESCGRGGMKAVCDGDDEYMRCFVNNNSVIYVQVNITGTYIYITVFGCQHEAIYLYSLC